MRYFPIFLDLAERDVLVVGGGEVACRKVEMLVRAGAKVTVVSPQVRPFLQALADEEQISYFKGFYNKGLLTPHLAQVWATTDNPELNHQVHQDATSTGILTNVVDDLSHCDFITPSMVNRGKIQLAISSGGASPVLVRFIRELLETQLPQNLSLLADFGSKKRDHVKQSLSTVDERRKFWELFYRSQEVEQASDEVQLEQIYQTLLNNIELAQAVRNWVEFGDDPELLTLKALRLMQQAELVLYAENCPDIFVDLCRRDAERFMFESEEQLLDYIITAQKNGVRVCILVAKNSQLNNHVLRQYVENDIYIPTH